MCAEDSVSDSELAQLLLGRCWPAGAAVLQQLSRTQGGLWSLPRATKERRRERARDLLQYRGVVRDPSVSLMGEGRGQMESRWDRDQTAPRQAAFSPLRAPLG